VQRPDIRPVSDAEKISGLAGEARGEVIIKHRDLRRAPRTRTAPLIV
jgi:hypothetical protein